MKAPRSFETSDTTRETTRRHIPEDLCPQQHVCTSAGVKTAQVSQYQLAQFCKGTLYESTVLLLLRVSNEDLASAAIYQC